MPAVDLNAISGILRESKAAAPVRERPAAVEAAAPEPEREEEKAPDLAPARRGAEAPDAASADLLAEIEDELGAGVEVGDGTADVGDTLKALAEKLGLDPADLYQLRIPMGGDGSTMSLGELKDIAKGAHEIEASKLAFDEAVATERRTLQKDREDIQSLIGMLPREALTPAMIEHARRGAAEYVDQQGRILAELVPEWRDPKVYADDRALMLEHVQKAGWNADDLAAVHDAKLLAYFRNQARREMRTNEVLKRIKAAGSLGRGFRTNVTAKAAYTNARAVDAARSGSRDDKVNAINQILKGTMK